MTKYDLVLYGATGFTGKLVANYLASHQTGHAFRLEPNIYRSEATRAFHY
jgi:short subunit dehydrogenase-like uncharacterized protein